MTKQPQPLVVSGDELLVEVVKDGRAASLYVLLYHVNCFMVCFPINFTGSSDGKASAYNAGHRVQSLGEGRSPGKGNGNPLQHSCLENPMDREAW